MTPPLRLNHLYRVVDRETFAAAGESTWLREVFAPSELRTTKRPDWSYTGLYWYGTSTYLELFEEGPQGPVGASGMAFALERPGDTAAVASAWRDALGDVDERVVVRPVPPTEAGGSPPGVAGTPLTQPRVDVPWFHIAHAVPDRREGLHLWSMEYHPDFLAAWHPDATDARGITRAEVLQRYARVSGGPAAPLLDDVVAVRLALPPGARGFLEQHVSAFDATVRDVGDDGRYVEGDDIALGITPASPSRQGVQDIVCRLRRSVGRESITIGRSVLDVDGTRVVWKFRDGV